MGRTTRTRNTARFTPGDLRQHAKDLAHVLLHTRRDDGGHSRQDRALIEAEAESVCSVVCRAFGHDTTSNAAAYIRSHGGSADTVLASLHRIARTAKHILDYVDPTDDDSELHTQAA
ncbi:MAG: hypothetical protein GF320_15340 [Armatimonadia bacterium]|nr:hypothetical protein [Armatimonadia bacterium]